MSVLVVRDFANAMTETQQMRLYMRSLRSIMTERELAKLAEYQDEDAIHYEDLDLEELLRPYETEDDAKRFKEKYGEFYDDIKFKEKDWW